MVEIMRRGKVFLTPLKHKHFEEIERNLSPESVRELELMGYEPADALETAVETSQAYAIIHDEDGILCISGLSFFHDLHCPQMYAMFTTKAKAHRLSLLRGSKMLLAFFSAQHSALCMTILTENDIMLQWASWLGFEAVGISNVEGAVYANFVRCENDDAYVETEGSRPVMH